MSRSVRASSVLVLLLGLFLAGCGERELFRPEDRDVLVVDAVLIVDRALPPVLLSRTLAPDRPFDPAQARESGAVVRVEIAGGEVYAYEESVVEPGRYVPVDGVPLVRPGTEYRLRVETTRGEFLTARTLTPPRLETSEWRRVDATATVELGQLRGYEELGDGVYEAAENQLVWGDGLLEARFVRDPAVSGYQVALFSLDPESDFAIDPDFFEEEDFESLDRENVSPMFEAVDGLVRLPWFAVFFEGRYQIKLYATDANWNDLVRTSPSLNQGAGFGGNLGDGFERPVFHVEGGIGLFGSAAVDSIGFFVIDDD